RRAAGGRRAEGPEGQAREFGRGCAVRRSSLGFFLEESARDTRCARVAAEWFVRMRPPGASPPNGIQIAVVYTSPRSEIVPRERPMPASVPRSERVNRSPRAHRSGCLGTVGGLRVRVRALESLPL